MIRKDADKASVQGVFMTKNKRALDFLAEHNIPFEDVIIVERSIERDRPSLSEINGKIVTNGVLKDFGSILALSEVQGENSFLMKPDFQLELWIASAARRTRDLAELKNFTARIGSYQIASMTR